LIFDIFLGFNNVISAIICNHFPGIPNGIGAIFHATKNKPMGKSIFLFAKGIPGYASERDIIESVTHNIEVFGSIGQIKGENIQVVHGVLVRIELGAGDKLRMQFGVRPLSYRLMVIGLDLHCVNMNSKRYL
jgi:hypothetical protein